MDIGAYEIDSPQSILSYAWAAQYGIPTDGSADYLDPDGDQSANWQESRAGTNPNNMFSLLKVISCSKQATGLQVTWQGSPGRFYALQRSTNLITEPFSTIQRDVFTISSTVSYLDSSATNGGPYFYRVGVQ